MDRVKVCTQEEILEFIDADDLSNEFGGNIEYTTIDYIEFVNNAVLTRRNDLKKLRKKGQKNVKKISQSTATKSKVANLSNSDLSKSTKSEVTVTEDGIRSQSEDPNEDAVSSDSDGEKGNLDEYLANQSDE